MRDLKYIIKRILICVGIILVLAYIRTGKALALDTTNMTLISNYRIKPNTEVYGLYYDRTSNRYYVDNPRGDSEYITNATDYPYIYCWNWKRVNGSDFASAINGVADSDQVKCVFSDKKLKYFYNSQYALRFMVSDSTFNYKIITSNYNNGVVVADIYNHTAEYNSTYNVYQTNYGDVLYNYPRNGIILSNFDIYNFSDNELYYGANLSFIPGVPEFVSWNFYRNIQDGVVVSASVSPEFSNFDTDNFTYQWKFGQNDSWKNLEENEQLLNFKNNGIVYVRIIDNQNNVIDSANFTITVAGKVATDYDYDIIFSSTYSTSKTQNATLGITVEEVKTDIEFIPENSLLRYQYKFVPQDEDPTNVVWTTSATTNISYTTDVNGTIYARITDEQYNQLYTETYTISNIGDLAIGVGDTNNNNNFWTKISSKINYGGPVSSLFLIPVNFLTTLYSSMYNSNSCFPYSLNSLLGVSLQLDCINFKSIVGNSFYNMIDLLICFVLCIGIFKFILKLYNNLISMKEGVD